MPQGVTTSPKQKQPKPPKTKLTVFRNWKGVNQTDARIAIDDDELYWMENAITVGKGAIQVLQPPADAIARVEEVRAGKSIWGFTIRGVPTLILIETNGSARAIDPVTGTKTRFAPFGTFFGSQQHLTIWRDHPVLILDNEAGLFTYDGINIGGNIISGLAVTEHAPADMSVDIAAGTANYWGTTVTVSATNLSIQAADPTLPRIDIVTINQFGVPVVTTGVPATHPVPPSAPVQGPFDLPNLIVAEVLVTAGVTSILQSSISDTRTFVDRTGQAIAVFEGRVWIADGRTINYTAPNTYNDFSAANGAGSSEITDDAFQGNIVALCSALEELWIFGQSAVEAIANVQATGTPPNVTTTFSITNIVTNIGTNFPNSVIGYLRAIAFLAPFGSYALSGVTPQKISDKLDGLFPFIDTTGDVPAAVAIIQNFLVLIFLVTYTGTQAVGGLPPLPMLIIFSQGRWCFAVQNTQLRWITSLVQNGVAQCWGTDGTTIFQLFAGTAPATYKVQSKLSDLGDPTMNKALLKLGFEFQTQSSINPTVTADSEYRSTVVPITANNIITGWINSVGEIIQFVNTSNEVITFISGGTVLSRQDAQQQGRYLGWTMTGTDLPFRLQAVELETAESRKWSTPT